MNIESHPTISVIIPTCYRRDMLLQCIDSLLCQDYPAFEIIVIDQAENSTIERDLEVRDPGKKRINYLHALHAGAARARNLGVDRACGTIVAFIDDDAIAGLEWLRGIAKAFSGEPQPALMAGRILPIWNPSRPQWYPQEREFLLGLYDIGENSRALPETHLPIGANMAGLRDVVRAFGGFEESLGPNYFRKRKMVTGEETMLGKRIRGAGHPAVYEPAATVRHHISRYKLSRTYFLRRHFWEGVTISEEMRLLDQIGPSKMSHYRHHFREVCMAAARFALPGYKKTYPESDAIVRMTALSRLAYSSGVIYGVATLSTGKSRTRTECESA